MRKAVVVLVLVGLVALCVAGSASAFSGGRNTPISDPAYRTQLKSLFRNYGTANPSPFGTNAATGSAATAAEVEAGLTVARTSALVLPALSTIAVGVIAIPTAGYVGWKIGSPIGGFVYKRLTGTTYGGSTSSLTPANIRWMHSSALTASYSGFFGSGTIPPGWYFNYEAGTVAGMGTCTAAASPCPAGAKTQASAALVAIALADFSNPSVGRYELLSGTNGSVCSTITPTTACGMFWMTNQEYVTHVNITTDDAAGYAASSIKRDASTWAPPASTSDAELDAGIDSVGGFDGATGTKSQEAAVAAINHALDPGWEPGAPPPGQFQPFILPQPQPTETYSQYVARLRAMGWVGTLTVEPASALEAAADPASAYASAPLHAPAGVQVSGASMVWLFDVGAPRPGDRPDPQWPDNPPHVPTRGTPITVKEKPGSSAFPPPVGGGGGDCDCVVDDLDFAPLTSLDFGAKFPFGIPAFVTGTLDALGLDDNCLAFDFDKPGGGTVNVSLCSAAWEDDYRPWVFPLFLFLILPATLVPLAYRIIGIRKGTE